MSSSVYSETALEGPDRLIEISAYADGRLDLHVEDDGPQAVELALSADEAVALHTTLTTALYASGTFTDPAAGDS